MSSAPIAIKSTTSSPSSGLYVPVHKRRSSIVRTDDSMSTTSSSRPSSRAESHVESPDSGHDETLVYSRDRLLELAKSPLATMPKEVKDELRERLPEIVMSRKHRKAIEYRTMMQQRGQTQGQGQTLTLNQSQTQGKTAQPVTHAVADVRPTMKTAVELAPPLLGGQNLQSTQQQQRHTTYSYYHINQPSSNAPQQLHRLQSQVSRDSQYRSVGRAWWNAPKDASANGMSWRRTAGPASISVVLV